MNEREEYTPTMDDLVDGYAYCTGIGPVIGERRRAIAKRAIAAHDKALREQIAESLLDDSPDGIFAAAYVRLMDPQPGDPPVRTFMRVMDIIAACIARGEWEQ